MSPPKQNKKKIKANQGTPTTADNVGYKRGYTSPLENDAKRADCEEDDHQSGDELQLSQATEDVSCETPVEPEVEDMIDLDDPMFISVKKMTLIQQKKVDNIVGLKKDQKLMVKSLMQVFWPVIGAMGSSIVQNLNEKPLNPIQETQVKDIVSEEINQLEERVEKRACENSMRVRNALIEEHYRTDRVSCRQRFRNLRIRGFDEDTTDLVEFVMTYARDGGVTTLVPNDIERIYELDRRNSEYSRAIIVTFASVRARNLFVTAKHEQIKKRKKMEEKRAQTSDTSEEYADLTRRIRSIKRIKVSEDLTPLRAKLLGLVRRLSNVGDAYTRDALIHAVTDKGKVMIDSPLDLYKLGIRNIPFNELGMSENITGLVDDYPWRRAEPRPQGDMDE